MHLSLQAYRSRVMQGCSLGLFVWHLKNTGIRQVPCQFVHLCRAANNRLITFQYFNFLKRMYVTQYNKDLSQRAKPKSDSVASPFRELQQLDQEKKVIHKISPISPAHQPLSETSSRNELREVASAAETEDSVTPVRAESKEDRQWKEMKLRLDDLPGILARLSKIKLTALVVSTTSAGFAMAPVPFDLTCFLLASLGTGLASCAANSINQPPACRLLCRLLRSPRHRAADAGGEPAHRRPGGLQHFPVHVLLHAHEENEHRQHVGGSCRRGHSPRHGLDCGDRQSGCWVPTVGLFDAELYGTGCCAWQVIRLMGHLKISDNPTVSAWAEQITGCPRHMGSYKKSRCKVCCFRQELDTHSPKERASRTDGEKT
nr:protoheme IX farnesyltransferase, mitochondrial isoform X2 [Columba livia]